MEQFVISFLLTSLAMSAIIIAISIFNALFGKAFTAKLRYAVWLVVLIGLIIPLRPAINSGIVTIPLPASTQTQHKTSEAEGIEIQPVLPSITAADTADSPFFGALSFFVVCVLVWGIIALMIFAFHIWRYIRFLRTIQRWSVTVKDENILSILRAAQTEMGLSNKMIDLKVCGFVSSSMLTGFWRPMILLPEKRFESDELELILRHELVHYKRRDLFINFLSLIAISVHWFNPIIYWMCAAMQIDGEVSCDEAVLLKAGKEKRRFYAEVIIGMIGEKNVAKTMLATCFYGGKSGIRRRLEFIMDTTRKMKLPAILVLVTITALTLLSGSVFAFSIQEPRVVPELMENDSLVSAAKIAPEKAEHLAMTKAGGGMVIEIELECKQEQLVYEVEIRRDRWKHKIKIDAVTGEIVEFKDSSLRQPYMQSQTQSGSIIQAAQITFKRAEEIAVAKAGGGTVIEVELGRKQEQLVYEVEIRRDRRKHKIMIDARTGEIVELKSKWRNNQLP